MGEVEKKKEEKKKGGFSKNSPCAILCTFLDIQENRENNDKAPVNEE